MGRDVNIITDLNGNQVALLNAIAFKGKRTINWDDVENYLKRYVGKFYEIVTTNETIYIGKDLPNEYAHSNYTYMLKGANAKAKANAAQALPEMLRIASRKQFEQNKEEKHRNDAKYGWHRYESRFAVPIYGDLGVVDHYNVFRVNMLIRHASDEKMYLYDVLAIKKETSNLFKLDDFTQ